MRRRSTRQRALWAGAALLVAVAQPDRSVFSGVLTANGGEFRVNSYTFRGQGTPDVVYLPSGDFVVVWSGRGPEAGIGAVRAQRFGRNGTRLGQEFDIGASRDGAYVPSVAAHGDSGFVVAWGAYYEQSDDTRYVVRAQRLDSDGRPRGARLDVSGPGPGHRVGPDVAVTTNQHFMVTWRNRESPDEPQPRSEIFARVFDANGVGGDAFQVTDYTTGLPTNPTVTVLVDDRFLVTWQDFFKDGSRDGVFGRLYAEDGTALGDEFQVNAYTTNNQQRPKACPRDDGGFLVTWQRFAEDVDGLRVVARTFDRAAAPTSAEMQVNTYTSGGQGQPVLAPAGPQDFVVAWRSYDPFSDEGQDGDGAGIFGRIVGANASPLSNEFQVNTHTTGDQGQGRAHAFAASGTGQGDLVVVWVSGSDQDGSSTGVFGQRYCYLDLSEPTCGNATCVGGDTPISLTTTDALLALQTSVALATCPLCLCDVDGSGIVASTDALIVLQSAVAAGPQALSCPPCQ